MATLASDLKGKILLAALACSDGDLEKTFTMEELVVAAWKLDPIAFGLRGFENVYPDSHRMGRELDSRGQERKGLIDQGLLAKVQARVYRLTVKGLQSASNLAPDRISKERVSRSLGESIRAILDHPVFKAWLKDSSQPKSFREAGHFWGVAPGTPSRVIRERIESVDDVIQAATEELDVRGRDELEDGKGRVSFDREDLAKIKEFQKALRGRFAEDLRILKAYAS